MLKADFRPLTAHDYRELPQGPPYHQLIEGDLYMAPSPDRLHQDILGNLFLIIRSFLEKHLHGSVVIGSADAPVATYTVKQTFESRLLPGLTVRVTKIFQR